MKLKPLALSLVCLMLPATAAWGRTFVADNIKYEVMSESEHTARLIGLEERNLIISIPGEVTDSDSGDTFSVAEVGPGAFKGMNFYDIYVRAGKGPLHFAEGAMESATVQNLDLYRDFTAPVNHEPFYEMESLKTVTISDGCTYIPPFSFAKSSVSSVSVNSTTLETIGFGSFEQTPLTTLSFRLKALRNTSAARPSSDAPYSSLLPFRKV